MQFPPIKGNLFAKSQRSRGVRVIAYWVFESTKPFPRMLERYKEYDEIWTPSTFCTRYLARYDIPALTMPHPMDARPRSIVKKVRTFTVIFNGDSGENRKNPLGALLAFASAFKPSDKARLILKGTSVSTKLQHEVQYVREETGLQIELIDAKFDEEEMEELWEATDCLVSMHKSEGFGLHIAEAMLRGIPTIATNYSGSVDFTRFGGTPVKWKRIDCDDVVPLGGTWAWPSIEHAAEQMRSNWRQPHHVDVDAIEEYLNPQRIGDMMRERLQ